MAKGLRFFGTNFNDKQLGGTILSSSALNLNPFAFDGLTGTRWTTSGENTDGNSVLLGRAYGFNRTVNSFYIYNTNISDLIVRYWNGSTFVNLDSSNATIIKDSTQRYIFIRTNVDITTNEIDLIGTNTLVANQEKFVTLFMAFQEIGQFRYFPDFLPKMSPEQNIFKTTDGRNFVIERGEAFGAVIALKSHVKQEDIDLAEALLQRKEPFFIWPNGGDENIFRFKFRPYRFQDIYKCTIIGEYEPQLNKNYYRAGMNCGFELVEVV